jgi:paraquat-inducible protein A
VPATPVTCRRCGQPYLLPERPARLLACPWCRASPRPLLQGNRAAALLAFMALIILAPAVLLPFITSRQLGEEHSYSLLGGIVLLLEEGGTHLLLGLLLGLFSILFPLTKLLALLAATSASLPLRRSSRQRLSRLAELTGKYSLLDVVVVAILVVVIKLEGVASVRASSGTLLFAGAILLSLLAGFCVSFEHLDEADPETP